MIRIAEPILTSTRRAELLSDVLRLESDSQPNVRLQFVLTISGGGIARRRRGITGTSIEDSLREAGSSERLRVNEPVCR